MTETDDYLLGMAPDEIDRLGRQHTAWRDHTIKVWDSMDIDDGNTVVDLGCGPGFATEDLAVRVGAHGRVIGVDSSRAATATLSEKFGGDYPQISVTTMDVAAG